MAAFPPPFGAGLAFGAIVPSAGGVGLGLNGINDNLPKAPNLVDGDATYNPAVGVTIGGAGIFISATGWRLLAASQIQNYGGSFLGQAGVAGLTTTGGAGANGLQATGGSNSTAIDADGTGTGGGVFATGGATNGPGVTGTGGGTTGFGLIGLGASGGTGVFAEAGVSSVPALIVSVGNARFSGSSPAATADPGFNDYLCGANICKVWGMISTDGAGAVTLNDGYNVGAVSVTATYVLVEFNRDFANTNYAPSVSDAAYPSAIPATDWGSRAVGSVRVSFTAYGGGAVNPSTSAVRFAIHVMGRQ